MKKTVIIFLCVILLVLSGCSREVSSSADTQIVTENNQSSTEASSTSVQAEGAMEWPEITENGVDEALLFQNIDIVSLETIATELQMLVDETVEEERQNPEIVLKEGFTRVFESERYKRVVDMGEVAMKPLYLIIYKSESAGMYEYICAMALYELSGYDFTWANSKEFLEIFNSKILESKG